MSNKSFHACNNTSHDGLSNTWFTPKAYTEPLGAFDLDPCTESFRPYNIAKTSFCFDLGECGLTKEWFGRVWLNPPYGKHIGKWLDKMAAHGDGIGLVFSRTETKWSQQSFQECTAVFFIARRIHFIPANGFIKSSAANGNMFLIYGEHNVADILASGIKGTLFRVQKEEL